MARSTSQWAGLLSLSRKTQNRKALPGTIPGDIALQRYRSLRLKLCLAALFAPSG